MADVLSNARSLSLRRVLLLPYVEGWKWFACVVMLVEHTFRYAIGTLPQWSYALGRSVFPLFALSLAVSLGSLDRGSFARVLRRLAMCAVLSSLLLYPLRGIFPLNVCFTLLAGCLLASGLLDRAYVVVFFITVLSVFVEFDARGVWAVALLLLAWHDGPVYRVHKCVAAMVLILSANGDFWALLSLLVIALFKFRLPRVRGAFYWAYVLQWPVIVGLRYAL